MVAEVGVERKRGPGRPAKLGSGARKVVLLMTLADIEALDRYAERQMWTRADAVREFVRRGVRDADGVRASA